jgi:hypothetical protein
MKYTQRRLNNSTPMASRAARVRPRLLGVHAALRARERQYSKAEAMQDAIEAQANDERCQGYVESQQRCHFRLIENDQMHRAHRARATAGYWGVITLLQAYSIIIKLCDIMAARPVAARVLPIWS